MPVRYNIDQITDDMVLGEAVVQPTGNMLLNAGYGITERYRQRLKELGYRTLLVHEPGTENVLPQDLVSSHLTAELTTSLEYTQNGISAIAARFREESLKDMHRLIFEHRNDLNQFIMNASMLRAAENILNALMEEPDVVLNLAALKNSANAFFLDSVNVAITAICLAKKFNLPPEDIRNLGIGALNYHLGMLVLPPEILSAETLTDEERKLYHNHTLFGYLMLSQNRGIATTSAVCALQHHEYQNGSGYPGKLKGGNRPPLRDISQMHTIHRFAEIVTVADTYNTLTRGLDRGDIHGIQSAMEKMIKLSGEILNREIVKTLVNIIPIYPVGTRVRVIKARDPEILRYAGVVTKDNPKAISRPEILLYQTLGKQKLDRPISIDLIKYQHIEIEPIL